ncbi:MAG: phosphoribosylformylglycinamidine cyclo-ligase [Candidatus Rokuibacteriota bacterium]
MDPLTYRAAGVDIRAGDEAVRRIAPLAASTHRPEVLGGIGSFAAFCRVPFGYQDPVLVSSTDGVGTKLKIAVMADRHDTIGLDLVAMGVNDVLAHGAEPLFFLDYLAVHRVEPARIEAIVSGIAAGCRQAGCALVGGETAEMGALYAPGEYDLAGFAVGVAERSGLITGEHVTVGDRVLGLASSGLHSNGYTLAREAIFGRMGLKLGDPIPGVGRGVGDELLEPSRIYFKPELGLIRQTPVKAMAHVTGGGITENLPRVLPAQRCARIDRRAWPEPPIFAAIQRAAAVDDVEMRRTFNMGIGFVLIVAREDVASARRHLETAGERVYEIGEIVPGTPGVDYV